jgi:hypothetical protein
MRRRAGCDPSVYCALSTWPAVRQAFAAAGVPEPHYWIASWNASQVIPPGAVALQYEAMGSYDLSLVDAYWPGVDNGQTIDRPAPAASPSTGRGLRVTGQLTIALDGKRLGVVGL